QAKQDWLDKYGGPTPQPALPPAGTQIIPLAWAPSDAQMIEARQMTLTHIAHCFNLDSYLLGAAGQGQTLQDAAPAIPRDPAPPDRAGHRRLRAGLAADGGAARPVHPLRPQQAAGRGSADPRHGLLAAGDLRHHVPRRGLAGHAGGAAA